MRFINHRAERCGYSKHILSPQSQSMRYQGLRQQILVCRWYACGLHVSTMHIILHYGCPLLSFACTHGRQTYPCDICVYTYNSSTPEVFNVHFCLYNQLCQPSSCQNWQAIFSLSLHAYERHAAGTEVRCHKCDLTQQWGESIELDMVLNCVSKRKANISTLIWYPDRFGSLYWGRQSSLDICWLSPTINLCTYTCSTCTTVRMCTWSQILNKSNTFTRLTKEGMHASGYPRAPNNLILKLLLGYPYVFGPHPWWGVWSDCEVILKRSVWSD